MFRLKNRFLITVFASGTVFLLTAFTGDPPPIKLSLAEGASVAEYLCQNENNDSILHLSLLLGKSTEPVIFTLKQIKGIEKKLDTSQYLNLRFDENSSILLDRRSDGEVTSEITAKSHEAQRGKYRTRAFSGLQRKTDQTSLNFTMLIEGIGNLTHPKRILSSFQMDMRFEFYRDDYPITEKEIRFTCTKR